MVDNFPLNTKKSATAFLWAYPATKKPTSSQPQKCSCGGFTGSASACNTDTLTYIYIYSIYSIYSIYIYLSLALHLILSLYISLSPTPSQRVRHGRSPWLPWLRQRLLGEAADTKPARQTPAPEYELNTLISNN